jgi:hypothetical protein
VGTVSGSLNCAAAHAALGPLLLGRLSEPEERELRAHLATCLTCARDLRELTPVVRLLSTVDADDVADLADEALHGADPESDDRWRPDAPLHLRQAVLQALAFEGQRARRRRRALVAIPAAAAAALVALLLIVGGVPGVGSVGGGHGVTAVESRAFAAVGGSGAAGTVTLRQKAGGTVLEIRARGMRIGEEYGFWVERPDGSRVRAGTWTAYDTTCHLVLQAAVPMKDADAVGFTRLDDHVDVARADL